MYRLNADGSAAVSTEYFWIPIEKVEPPKGAKVLLINKKYGVLVVGIYKTESGFTHWAPLPRFSKDEK